MTVRALTVDDLEWAVETLGRRRANLVPFAPVLWRPATSASRVHLAFLRSLITSGGALGFANNKAWDSAETVRRAWLAESFLTRTSPPKGAETFIALAVAHGEHPDDAYRLHADLSAKGAETTGEDWERRYNAKSNLTARADAAAPRQVLMLALALLVCEWESTTSRNTWRRPSDRDRRYLSALIGWGYQPSDVERLILAQPEPTEPTEPTESDNTAEPTEPTSSRPSRSSRDRADRAGRVRRHRRADWSGGLTCTRH